MAIKHVMKDGTCLDDITGHVVKMEEIPQIYEILGRIEGKCYEHNLETKIDAIQGLSR